jgi:HEAT repeat protein
MRRIILILSLACASILSASYSAFADGTTDPAVEALKKQLRTGSPTEKLDAVKKLSDLKTQAAFDALVGGLSLAAKDDNLRLEIVRAVASYKKTEAAAALKAIFNSSSDAIKQAIIAELGSYKGMGEIDVFMLALKDKSDKVRNEAIMQLNTHRDAPGVRDTLIQIMDRNDSLMKKAVLTGVPQEPKDDKEITILTKGLADRDPDVAQVALEVLKDTKMDDDKKVDLALSIKKTDDTSVRNNQVEVLRAVHTPKAVDALIALLKAEKTPGVSQMIIKALGGIGGESAAIGLADYVTNKNRDIKLAAVTALAGIQTEKSKEALLKAVADKDTDVLKAAVGGLLRFKSVDVIDPVVDAAIARGGPKLQVDVAKMLAEVKDPKAVEGLLKILDHGDPNAGLDVIQALGDKKAHEAVPIITTQLKKRSPVVDDPGRRFYQAAADALGKIGGPETEEGLILIALSNAPVARLSALKGLGDFRSEGATKCIIQALSDPEPVIKIAALDALKHSLDPAGIDPAASLLTDPNRDVKLAAINTLGAYGTPKVASKLAIEYNDDKLYKAAVGALANIDSREGKDYLIKALSNKDALVRRDAMRGLGRSWAKGDADVVAAASKLLEPSESDQEARNLAALALGNAGTNEAMKRLEAMVTGKNLLDASAAITALGYTKSEAAADVLIGVMNKVAYDTRLLAIAALGKIGNEKAIQPLLDVMSQTEYTLRVAAVQAIGRFKCEAAKQALIKSLQDTNPHVVQAVLLALLKYGDGADVRALVVQTSGHDKPEIRKAAVQAMAYYGAPDMVKPLLTRLSDQDKSVSAASLKSLCRLLNRDLGTNPDDWDKWWQAHQQATSLVDAVNEGFHEKGYEVGGEVKQQVLEAYVKALQDTNDYIRFNAFLRLSAIAGDDFGYDPDKPSSKEALEKWNKWWQSNKGKYN